jgi:hypothetical protein
MEIQRTPASKPAEFVIGLTHDEAALLASMMEEYATLTGGGHECAMANKICESLRNWMALKRLKF